MYIISKLRHLLKELLTLLFAKPISNCCVDGFDIISFDVFDTLLLRTVKQPTDVFDEICKDDSSFKRKRIYAEQQARMQLCNSEREDITIEEIYSKYAEIYNLDINKCIGYMQEEISVEKSKCFANPELLTYFNALKKCEKHIIIISDMYLSSTVISQLLSEAGYNLDGVRIYVSSEVGATKRNGSLFRIVVNTERSDNIIHIGDDVIRDFLVPRFHGMTGYLVKSK